MISAIAEEEEKRKESFDPFEIPLKLIARLLSSVRALRYDSPNEPSCNPSLQFSSIRFIRLDIKLLTISVRSRRRRLLSGGFDLQQRPCPQCASPSRVSRTPRVLPLDTRFGIADKSAFEGDGVTVVGLSYHRSFGEGRFNTVLRYGCLVAYVRHKRSTCPKKGCSYIHFARPTFNPFAVLH